MPSGTARALSTVQFGKEVTRGTPVAATEKLLAELSVDLSGYELFRTSHPFGVFAQNAGATPALKKDVELTLTADGVTYQQLPWWLSTAIDQVVTTGAGPFTHTYDPGLAAAWDPNSATIEARWSDGTNHEDVEFEYCMAKMLKLSAEANGQLKAESQMFGRQVTDATITSLTLPATLDPIIAAQGRVFFNASQVLADVDPPAAGLVSNQILSFDLEIDTGIFPWHSIQNQTIFAEHKERVKNFRLRLSALYDSAGSGLGPTERANAAAGTLRFVTLHFTGAGNLRFYITLAGKWEFGEFLLTGEQDGIGMFEATLVGHYDTTGAKLMKAVVKNDTATEPGP